MSRHSAGLMTVVMSLLCLVKIVVFQDSTTGNGRWL